jgi:hypothetical protein
MHASPPGPHTFSRNELRFFRGLKTPLGIQRFLDSLPYHLADTCWSPRRVLRERTAHCLEGAILAAAALRVNGFPPLLWDLEAEKDTDHVLAIFKKGSCWGAIAKSNFAGCRYREPVYRSLRELAMSYFNVYFNLRGERSLRRYSQPVNLSRFDRQHWMTSDSSVWFIAEYLCDIPHRALLTTPQIRRLTRIDQRTRAAEMLGHRKKQSRDYCGLSREACGKRRI